MRGEGKRTQEVGHRGIGRLWHVLLRTSPGDAARRHGLGAAHLQRVHYILTEILISGVELVACNGLDVLQPLLIPVQSADTDVVRSYMVM